MHSHRHLFFTLSIQLYMKLASMDPMQTLYVDISAAFLGLETMPRRSLVGLVPVGCEATGGPSRLGRHGTRADEGRVVGLTPALYPVSSRIQQSNPVVDRSSRIHRKTFADTSVAS